MTPKASHDADISSVPSKLVNCQLTIPRFEGASGGQRLAIIGSVEQLGAWEPTKAVPLLPSEHNETMYTAIVQLPLGEKIEAKVWGNDNELYVQI
jgi:hypothetical protein